ncbi:MAG: histidine kinase [Gammaproteobacteria bacterium]|nr:histidine kinase [Gammaproteobacteria bacterium]
MKKTAAELDNLFLPDFCAIRMVFVVVIIAELAAFVLALAPLGVPATERWNNLGQISFFMQWCALASSALLCVSRPFLARLAPMRVGMISLSIILFVIVLVSEGAYQLFQTPLYGENREQHLQFMLRNLAIGIIISAALLRYFYIQHQWRTRIKAESKARLQALQSRIRPHFLFNSMNTIASLTRISPDKAETAVENLSDLFRASLIDTRESLTLKEEINLCQRYLDIESLRLGERLQVHWEINNLPMDALVPPLLLQPLLENAVYHGIETSTEGGTISIEGHVENQCIHLQIENPMSHESTHSNKRGHQIAQDNIRERLHTLYGGRAGLELQAQDGRYRTHLFFPYIDQPHEDSYR